MLGLGKVTYPLHERLFPVNPIRTIVEAVDTLHVST
jgi:hypothetical protein